MNFSAGKPLHIIVIEDDEVDAEAVEYLFTEGNYSCDCNRSLMLRRAGHDVPEMPCGEGIQLVRFRMGAES